MSQVWLTPDELATRLRIPRATLYQWRYRGEGPRAVKVGRHLRYRLADVERWERTLERLEREDARALA
ncbi:MAG TPA: helix-turn-helix domain-containing protein [Gemmataceae bacterium]